MHSLAPRPRVLVTNDDGIGSHFLKRLVEALTAEFEVYLVAPQEEQSGTSHAITYGKSVAVQKREGWPTTNAWSVSGTPTDCVNLALGHLLEGKKPDLVVSGINLGPNTSLPITLLSGTVGGALEGALWGIPSIAFSKRIDRELLPLAKLNGGQNLSPQTEDSLVQAARRSVEIARDWLHQTQERPQIPARFLNVNFPTLTQKNTPLRHTRLARARMASCFEPESPGSPFYHYRSPQVVGLGEDPQSDSGCLRQGWISLSELDWGALSQPQELGV